MVKGQSRVHYDIVVASFRLSGAEPPGKVLEQVLGVSAEEAKALLRHFPAVVASRLDEGRAEQVLALLKAAGARAELRESVVTTEVRASSPQVGATSQASAGPPAAASEAMRVAASVAPGCSGVAAPSLAPAEPSAEREQPPAAYQLGELDLGLSPRSQPPTARPPQAAPAAAKPAPVQAQLASSGRGSRPSAAGPSADGMRTFGDGFDDMEVAAPALELDRASRWRGDNTVGLDRPKAKARARDSMASATRLTRPPAARASFSDGWKKSVWELVKVTLGATTAVSLVLATGFYIRDPEAAAELFGLSPPPAMGELTREIMDDGARLAEMKSTGLRKMDPSMGDIRVTVRTAAPPLHPLLRLAPNVSRPFVARLLRTFVSDVEEVKLEGLSASDGLVLPVDCMLVRHDPSDVRDRATALRVATLLRTGSVLQLPAGGEQLLVNEMARTRGRRGVRPRFTPLCMARF